MSDDANAWTAKAKARQVLASPDHRAFLDQAKGQLLIVLVKRLGGSVTLPISEVDDTGGQALSLAVRDGQIVLSAGAMR